MKSTAEKVGIRIIPQNGQAQKVNQSKKGRDLLHCLFSFLIALVVTYNYIQKEFFRQHCYFQVDYVPLNKSYCVSKPNTRLRSEGGIKKL